MTEDNFSFVLPDAFFGDLWNHSLSGGHLDDSDHQPILLQDDILITTSELDLDVAAMNSSVPQMYDEKLVAVTETTFNFPILETDYSSVVDDVTSSDFPDVKCDVTLAATGENPSSSAVLENVKSDPPDTTPVASLVAINNWVGDYDFNANFEENGSAQTAWTYSPVKDKLYVKKDAALPMKFKTNQHMPYNTKIRAMAVYDQAQYASEVVTRCFNHIQQDIMQNIPYCNHLIKCESKQAVYEEDPNTKRLSVVFPYENPHNGQHYNYILKFSCLGSCAGGLNRRPITIVFTLESGGRVIGRRSMGLRLCACPRRDRMMDEQKFGTKEGKFPKSDKKRGLKRPLSDDGNESPDSNITGGSPSNERASHSSTPPPNGPYCIRVQDYKLFLFLKKAQKMYLMHGTWEKLPQSIRKFIQKSSTSSESSASSEEKQSSGESD